MNVFVESIFPCSAERAWAAVQTSALLLEVCRPLVVIEPVPGEPLPDRWEAETESRCRSFLFGLIPLGTRRITFLRIDQRRFEIQTHETDPLVKRWDHQVRVRPLDDKRCWYFDEIEIDAGRLTLLVWLFANLFYRHRQHRWQAVARRLQAAG